MKRTISLVGILTAVIMAGAAIFWGCNRGASVSPTADRNLPVQPKKATDLSPNSEMTLAIPHATAVVTNVVTDLSSNTVRFSLTVQPDKGTAFDRTLSVQLNEDASHNVFLNSSLEDSVSTSLWSFTYQLDDNDPSHVSMAITTPVRSILTDRRVADSVMIERYQVDGVVQEARIPVASRDHLEELYREGSITGRFVRSSIAHRLPSDKDLIAALENFQSFYTATEGLDCGADCALGMQLLQSTQLMTRFKAETLRPGGNPSTESFWRKLCGAAGVCTMLACLFGSNPVCVGCGIVAGICAIADLFFGQFDVETTALSCVV